MKHKFSALFRADGRYLAVDICEKVAETDVLRGRIKEQDVAIPYCIQTSDAPPGKAVELARYYGITLVTSSDLNRLGDVMKGKPDTKQV